jgi:subfamily B ATP-binding cassette protein MsbA
MWSTYKRLWREYIKAYIPQLIAAVFMSIAVAGLTATIAWMIEPVINKIFDEKNTTMLYLLPAGIVGIYFTRGLFAYMQGYLMALVAQGVVTNIRNDVYKQIVYLPVIAYQHLTTGVLSARIVYEVNILQRVVATSIQKTVQQFFTVIFLTFVLFYREWRLALIAVLVLPCMGVIIRRMGLRTKKLVTEQNEEIGNIFGFLNDTLSSPRILKSFRTEQMEVERFKGITAGIKKLLIKIAKVRALTAPIMEFLGSIGIAGVILYGGYQVIQGTTTSGEFFSFMGALMMFYTPLKALSNMSNTFHQAMVSAERIFQVIDMDTEERELIESTKPPLESVEQGIEYDGVDFMYEGAEQLALENIRLNIKRGEVVAFVGSSGAGKTTIINLLPRFYEVTNGAIRIDGVNIQDYSLSSLRGNISLVSQDVMLFDDTVGNNIAYGTEGATEEQVFEAARAAYAHDFIMEMPDGYRTMIGEKGSKLSGGEKQRLAIARAIVKDAPILILDEATSSLDSESELMVQKAMENLVKNRTTLIIAHRLSTVRDADKIFVVDGGRIVEQGTHYELLEKNGCYKKLHDIQFLTQENSSQPAAGNG